MYKKTVITTLSLAISFLPLKVLAQDISTQQSYVGFAVEDNDGIFQEVEKLTLNDTRECINKVSGKKIAFISDRTPAAEDRRVIITNVTKDKNNNYVFGDTNSLPYTDREYEQDSISEDIKVAIGLEHVDDKLAVTTGQNQFKYEIVDLVERDGREWETVVENGQFSITVEIPVFNFYSVTCESLEREEKLERQRLLEENLRWQEERQRDSLREWEEKHKREVIEDSNRRLHESLREDFRNPSWQEELNNQWEQDRFEYEDRFKPDLQQQLRQELKR